MVGNGRGKKAPEAPVHFGQSVGAIKKALKTGAAIGKKALK